MKTTDSSTSNTVNNQNSENSTTTNDNSSDSPLALIHAGVTDNCIQCHEKDRPAAVGTVTHGGGEECILCHNFTEESFKFLGYSHSPEPAECSKCHANDRPGGDHPTDGDCKSCHTTTSFTAAINFTHEPRPATCEGCHTRPTTTSARAYPNQGPPANFDPNDPNEPGSGHMVGKDCAGCHQTPAEGAQSFTFTHSGTVPQVCLPCHYNDGFREHNGDNRGVILSGFGNCVNCHGNFDRNIGRNWGRN